MNARSFKVVHNVKAVRELKAQTMNLQLNFDNSTNAQGSTSAPIAGYAVLPAGVPSRYSSGRAL